MEMHRAAVRLKKGIFHTFTSRDRFSFIIEYTSNAENVSCTRFFARTHTCLGNRLSPITISKEYLWNVQRSAEKRLTLDEAANDPRIPTSERERTGFVPRIAAKTGRRVSAVLFMYVKHVPPRNAYLSAFCLAVTSASDRQMSDTRTYAHKLQYTVGVASANREALDDSRSKQFTYVVDFSSQNRISTFILQFMNLLIINCLLIIWKLFSSVPNFVIFCRIIFLCNTFLLKHSFAR